MQHYTVTRYDVTLFFFIFLIVLITGKYLHINHFQI